MTGRVGEPAVRDDGRCCICLKPRRPERSRQYAGPMAEFDAFCSNLCARAWWGNPLPAYAEWRRRKAA